MAQCLLHSDVHVSIHVDRRTVDVSADLSFAIKSKNESSVRLRCRPSILLRSITLLDDEGCVCVPCTYVMEEYVWDASETCDLAAFEEAAGHKADLWERGNLVITLPQRHHHSEDGLAVLRIVYTCAEQALWHGTVCRPSSAHDWLLESTGAKIARGLWNVNIRFEGSTAAEWTACTSYMVKETQENPQPIAFEALGFHAQRNLVLHALKSTKEPFLAVHLWTASSAPVEEVSVLSRLVISAFDALCSESIVLAVLGDTPTAPTIIVSDELASCGTTLVWHGLVFIDRQQCLFSAAYIDPVYSTIDLLCEALCRHVVEHALVVPSAGDRWFVDGVSSWLASRCIATLLGTNERKYRRMRKALQVVQEDGASTAIWSRPLAWHGHLLGAAELDTAVYRDKALVVMEMLEQRLSETVLVDLITQLLTCQPSSSSSSSSLQAFTTQRLEDACAALTEMGPFFHQWVYCNGYPHMRVSFRYSLQSKTTKVRVEQCDNKTFNYNHLRFTGALKFRIHELDKTHEQVRGILANSLVSPFHPPLKCP
jgi:hypothetical protein